MVAAGSGDRSSDMLLSTQWSVWNYPSPLTETDMDKSTGFHRSQRYCLLLVSKLSSRGPHERERLKAQANEKCTGRAMPAADAQLSCISCGKWRYSILEY